jgi:Mg/Co/Ni transporter MgtE
MNLYNKLLLQLDDWKEKKEWFEKAGHLESAAGRIVSEKVEELEEIISVYESLEECKKTSGSRK